MNRRPGTKPHGEIRQSQVVTTFGPGAMVDLPNHSVLVAGLDFWSKGGDEIIEPRLTEKLAKLLDIPTLRLFTPPSEQEEPCMKDIARVVLVHRLREVMAQVGFTRFEAAAPDIEGELEMGVRRASLAREVSWLPAIENKGEGVFIQFSTEAIEQWRMRTDVQTRGRQLDAGFSRWRDEHQGSRREFPGMPYLMLHSFSHMLITAVALECGYPASSIRERIYALSGIGYGVLLYTGTSDAEGTLGGLIQVGRRIHEHIRSALELGELCSNDPVCAQHVPESTHEHRFLHGAACHGCLLIAETSCEQQNDFLDRALVVPTVDNLGVEFFAAGS